MTCAHYWILESGNEAMGRCVRCGAERMHHGGVDYDAPSANSQRARGGKAGGVTRRTKAAPKDAITHGTTGYRKRRCRCEVCSSAHHEYMKRYLERGKAVA